MMASGVSPRRAPAEVLLYPFPLSQPGPLKKRLRPDVESETREDEPDHRATRTADGGRSQRTQGSN